MRKGWEIKLLVKVCQFKSGTTVLSKLERKHGEILYAKVGDMTLEGNERDIIHSSRFVNLNDINSNQIIPIGSVVFPKRGGAIATNKKRRIVKPTIVDLNTMAVIPSKAIDDFFLFYWFQQIDLTSISNGTSIPQINNYSFDNLTIAYPLLLSEQKRIVSILDRAFAAIDKVKANTEKNLQNAKELFDSYLQKVFGERGEDWEEKKLGEICHIIGGGTPSKDNKRYYTGSIYWATVRDMKNDLIADTEYQITDEAVKQSATNIIPKGNVVIATRVGLGKACLLIHDTAINQDLKGVIPKKGSNLSVEFLFRWFKRISKHIIEAGTGATVQGVKLTFINSLIISYPTLKKQRRIIESIDQVEKETQKLILKYQQKLISLDELKKSILQKAFSGQLSESRIFAD